MSQETVVERADLQRSRDLQRVPFGISPDEVASIIAQDGGVILTGVFTRAQVDEVNQELDLVMGPLETGNFGDGDKNFLGDFMGGRTKRLVHCVKYSRTLRETLFSNNVLASYVAAVLTGEVGTHSLWASQAIEIFPGERLQTLHRDGSGLYKALGLEKAGSREVRLASLIAMTDVTEEMGATRVIPRSHLWESVEGSSQDQTIPATMNAGDMLLYAGKLIHGGGANVTKNSSRRLLSTGFAPGFILGEEAWPFVLSVEEVRDYPKLLQSLLGFRSVSFTGEQPGFLWRAKTRPLEQYLDL